MAYCVLQYHLSTSAHYAALNLVALRARSHSDVRYLPTQGRWTWSVTRGRRTMHTESIRTCTVHVCVDQVPVGQASLLIPPHSAALVDQIRYLSRRRQWALFDVSPHPLRLRTAPELRVKVSPTLSPMESRSKELAPSRPPPASRYIYPHPSSRRLPRAFRAFAFH